MSEEVSGRHVMCNGIRLHYLEYQSGSKPLVLIPGITSPAITWDFVSRRLAEFGHVYALDNRGRGLSSGGPELSYWLEDYARDTADFIRSLNLDRPVILGHSIGARIAIKLAAQSPELVGKVVLADPPVSGPGRRPYPMPLELYLDAIDETSRGGGFESMRQMLPNWNDQELGLRAEWLPTCDKKAVEESYRSCHEEDIFSLLPKVKSHTLLVYAALGGTITDTDAREIIGALPDARSVRIDNVGHMIPWDDLDRFVSTVRQFVTS